MEQKKKEEKEEKKREIDICPDIRLGQIHGAFAYQAVTQPDARTAETNVILPDAENVERERNWSIEKKV